MFIEWVDPLFRQREMAVNVEVNAGQAYKEH